MGEPCRMETLCCMYPSGWRQKNIYRNKDYTWECTERGAESTKHTWRRLSLCITQLNMRKHVLFCSLDGSHCASGGCTFVFTSLFLGCESRLGASARLVLCNVCMQQRQPSCREEAPALIWFPVVHPCPPIGGYCILKSASPPCKITAFPLNSEGPLPTVLCSSWQRAESCGSGSSAGGGGGAVTSLVRATTTEKGLVANAVVLKVSPAVVAACPTLGWARGGP